MAKTYYNFNLDINERITVPWCKPRSGRDDLDRNYKTPKLPCPISKKYLLNKFELIIIMYS